ncbi:MAG: CoA-binding protein [Syntrophales bacterium]
MNSQNFRKVIPYREAIQYDGMMRDIEALCFPKSIAIIGASGMEGKIGNTIVQNVLNWQGQLYLVSYHEEEILGKKAFTDLSNIPDNLDLAIIALNAKKAVGIAKTCAEKKFKILIILSSGFSESDEEGVHRESVLKECVLSAGTRILGPNTLGVFVPGTGLDTIFVEHGDRMFSSPGDVTLITQSGSVGVEAPGVSGMTGWGLRAFIGLGNRIDIGENELLKYFARDEKTKSIAVYIETFQDGYGFLDICRSLTPEKPVIVLKAGRSDAAMEAVASHTGKMASPAEVFFGASKQSGIHLADNEEQLTDYSKILAREPAADNPNAAIITNAGGYGIISLDLMSQTKDLKAGRLAEETASRIKEKAPTFASINNPIDLTASSDNTTMKHALNVLEEDPSVGLILCHALFAPPKIDRAGLIEILISHRRRTAKPFIVFVAYGPFTNEIALTLYQNGVMAFTSLSRAIKAMDVLAERGYFLRKVC